MRTLVDIPDTELKLLNKLSKAGDIPRAELVRRAISSYLEPYKLADRVDGFGIWSDHPVDGLAYQEKIRGEW